MRDLEMAEVIVSRRQMWKETKEDRGTVRQYLPNDFERIRRSDASWKPDMTVEEMRLIRLLNMGKK